MVKILSLERRRDVTTLAEDSPQVPRLPVTPQCPQITVTR